MARRLKLLLGHFGVLAIAGALNTPPSFPQAPTSANPSESKEKNVRVVYPKKTELDFDGLDIRGQIRSPGEFYFQRRQEERFDSLVKPRKNFHREMLRDAVLSK